MDPSDELLAIEAIKRLKARYFRTVDTRDWQGFGEVFAPDAEFDVCEDVGNESGRMCGREVIVDFVRTALAGARTVHHGHMPEIEITAPEAARGIWAMYDYVEFESSAESGGGRSGLHGYGHYHETYTRQRGRWYIARLRLARLRIDPLT